MDRGALRSSPEQLLPGRPWEATTGKGDRLGNPLNFGALLHGAWVSGLCLRSCPGVIGETSGPGTSPHHVSLLTVSLLHKATSCLGRARPDLMLSFCSKPHCSGPD